MNNTITSPTFPSLRARAIEEFIADKVLSGQETNKREILEKLIANTDYSVNFIAYVTECSMAYVRNVKKKITTSLAQ